MNFEYFDMITLEEYKTLIRDAGWKVLSDKQIIKGLKNSMFISCCRVDGNIVGMTRIVGDYSTHGLLCDVVVLSSYRHMGVGRNLVNNIKDKVYNMIDKDEQFLIELCPASGKKDFYLNCGFKYKPENMDGMYLWIKK